jgi:ubiquinone/menaquinone biosynthesis C-methylase UbiE
MPADDFARYADARETRAVLRHGHRRRTAEVVGALREAFPDGAFRLLDVGTADGRMLATLAREFPRARLAGIEARDDLARVARDAGLDVEVGRAEDLPRADGSQDVVLLVSTLKHVPDHQRALSECRRVLAPGGRLLVSEPTPWGIRLGLWRGHFERRWLAHVWSLAETRRRLETAGFEVLRAWRYMPLPWEPPGIRAYERVARWLGLSRTFMQQCVLSRRPLAAATRAP